MVVDSGKYNKHQKKYHRLINSLYSENAAGVTLSPEYAHYVQNDTNRLLIRLSRYKFVAKMLQKSDTVLEVGCGSGLGAMFLGQYAKHVTGLDVKTTEIDDAKRVNQRSNVEFSTTDLFEMPLIRKYDAVVALDVIEHFSVLDGKKLLDAMAKHLNPGGMMIIGTPSIYSFPHQGKLSQASHIHCYDQDELRDLIGAFCKRTLAFSMNDEVVHTGNPKMAWYYFVIGISK